MVLRRIFGSKREEVMGGWRKLHNEKLYNLYTSTNVMGIIRSRKIRCASHVTRVREVCMDRFGRKT